MIKRTTALKKIASLRKRIKVIRGGQGSAKTISILILLINHASSKPNREIFIISAELTKMRLTVIKDFVKVMKSLGIFADNRFVSGTLYRFPNGSFIKFIGLDKDDVGKGLRSDIAYFNEVNKCDAESYRQVASRAKKVICDYNPDASFFIDTDVIPRDDCDFLQLTFEDNEALPEEERNEILRYKELGYDFEGNIISPYWANVWQVYGLGNIGSLQGVVFPNWEEIKEIPSDARLEKTGVDFGFSVSKFAALNIYNYNNTIILDELVYANDLTNPEAAKEMKRAGYTNSVTYCDSAEPKSIKELKQSGIRASACDSKRDIKDYAIKKLNEKTFLVTSRSVNLIEELRSYVWDKKTGKPKKSDKDHLMDAMMYAIGTEEKHTGKYYIKK